MVYIDYFIKLNFNDFKFQMIEFLVDNMFVVFAGKVFKQIIGISMGANCAPLIANIFLHSYEEEFIQHRQLFNKGKGDRTSISTHQGPRLSLPKFIETHKHYSSITKFIRLFFLYRHILYIDGNLKPSSLTILKTFYPPKTLRQVIIHFLQLHAP